MKILVVCTGNSCRSQMAEGLIKNRFPDFEVFSAGTHPESNVNPYAVRVMQEKGIDISSHYPKLVDDLFQFGSFVDRTSHHFSSKAIVSSLPVPTIHISSGP